MTERELIDAFGPFSVSALLAQLNAGASPQIDVDQLRAEVAAKAAWVDVDALLAGAVEVGWLKRVDTHRCVNCDNTLDDEFIAVGKCPYCQTDLTAPEFAPARQTLYLSTKPLSRSVPWLIAIHGMNTRGEWQETFSWLVANLYRYPAPVLTYKFGIFRLGVLFRFRHRMLVNQLGTRIRAAVELARARDVIEPPDIIAHSFGTQLVRLLLEDEQFQDLKFGRVITLGSVIRPDFDWSSQIARGRVEAVLNLCGARDCAVPFAQFTIPGAGPGGKHGFVDPKVANVKSDDSHSTALSEPNLQKVLTGGGAFECFLRLPLSSYENPGRFTPGPWKPWPHAVSVLTRMLVILALSLAGLALAGTFLLGARHAL